MNAGAAAAAAAKMGEEEEQMTNYSPMDLTEGWEFKILRSNTSAFKKPEVFAQVCAEEKEAGWVLVEKFDNARIRFKRPMDAKKNDHRLDFDPYRTVYGVTAEKLATIIILCLLGLGALIGGIVAFTS